MIPKKIYVFTSDVSFLDEETPYTRALVNFNPRKDETEYTDLSQVWHDAQKEPEKGKLMVGIDEDGVSIYKWVGQDECGWLSFAECNGLIRWAYVEDLLPKGGKSCKNEF